MLRKIIFTLLTVSIMILASSCSARIKEQDNTILFYETYNEETRELSNPVQYISAGKTEYVVFNYGQSFKSDSIGMTVLETQDEERSSIYDYVMIIDSESTIAVFPIEIERAAEYELVIYFESAEEPIASKKFYVFN